MGTRNAKKIRKLYRKEVKEMADTKLTEFMKSVNADHKEEAERLLRKVKSYRVAFLISVVGNFLLSISVAVMAIVLYNILN